ncbi:hypothetical protein [Microseira wollei]|nr:hypothetical protein [Microseira wollei]
MRFGELDAILTAFLEPISALPSAEFTLLLQQLPQLSDEELLVRLSNTTR